MPHSVLPYVNVGASRSSEENDVETVDSDNLNSDGELRYQVMGPDTQHPDVTHVAIVADPVLPEPAAQHPIIRVATMCPRVTGPVNPQHPVIIRLARKRAAVTGAVIPGPPAKLPAFSVVSGPSHLEVPGPSRLTVSGPSRLTVSGPSRLTVSGPSRLTVSGPLCPTVSRPAVSLPAVSCPTVSCPAVSCPAVSLPAVPGPSRPSVSRPAIPGLGNVHRFEWSDGHDFEPDIHPYDNTASGVTPAFHLENDGTDLEYFEAYFDDQVMGMIAEETNCASTQPYQGLARYKY
ncbi:hypothetical protein Pmani_013050 [Petrolisthes manimaculis]|uniref:Uncharacterized protein n=1 Tax=Petrolisthes manimaculis TaxID=1843537 RepID=A0AAE1PWR8_9EUCA|nr:hypothetical protein Pmani_013050 [Petrolisthes manimaculis]